jgi:NAD(P)-dependent dehydrogenase (short-subunit alcohol dehydrogenase family)
MSAWSLADIPDQSGRVALVTGANSGIGLEAARVLAHRGAHVVLACRSQAKAVAAQRSIEAGGRASLEILPLDLSSLAQVRDAAAAFRTKHARLDLLINNAGVMWLPRTLSAEGQEMQFATNHLGHFALTGHLLDILMSTAASRVVTVSSLAHAQGRIRFDDLSYANTPYRKHRAYAQSKVANLLFAKELARRLDKKGVSTRSLACHPGISATNLAVPGFQMQGSAMLAAISGLLTKLIAQDPAMGAQPTLYAATAAEAANGDYIGPSGFRQMHGAPQKVGCVRYARDEAVAQRLWQVSEAITGVRYL